MTDRIVQELGIDANQALQQIAAFDAAFGRMGATVERVGGQMRAFNGAQQMTAELDKLARVAPNAERELGRLTTSVQLLSRIAFTQHVVRAIRLFHHALVDGTHAAVEFQRSIARINTISDGVSVDRLASGVRELSDAFNVGLDESAAGVYQALSNQVGDFAQSLKFTAEAAQFSKATNSSLADSVDLLSAALKSYGLDVSDTDKVASTFFKTIDLGRIEANQLANSFGRVGPVAAALGVDFDELNGALAAISVQGSKTPEVLTQFRAILTALQKPSEEMKRALDELGFSSGQQAIRTLGLSKTLSELERVSGGSAERLAQMFANVRGLSGVTGLLNDELKTLTNDIREMESAGRDFSKEKFFQATATDAERVTKELNKLKNFFTVELGQAALRAGANLLEVAGGADELIKRIPGIAAGAAAVGAFKLATTGLNNELGVTSRLLSTIGAAGAAFAAGSFIGQRFDQSRSESLLSGLRQLEEINKKELESFELLTRKKRDMDVSLFRDRVGAAQTAFATLRQLYDADVNKISATNAAVVTSTTNTINSIVSARQSAINAITSLLSESEEEIRASQERIRSLTQGVNDRQFDQRIASLSPDQQAFARIKAAEDASRSLLNNLSRANPIDRKSLNQQLDAQFAILDGLRSTLSASGESARANKVLNDLASNRVRLEEAFQRRQVQVAEAAKVERQQQEATLAAVREKAKLIGDNTSSFDSKGRPLSAAELARRSQIRQGAESDLTGLLFRPEEFSRLTKLGLNDFVAQARATLDANAFELKFGIENSIGEVQSQLQQRFADFRLQVPFDLVRAEGLLGKKAGTADEVENLLTQLQTRATEERTALDQFAVGSERAKQLRTEIGLLGSTLAQQSSPFATIDQQVDALAQQFTTLSQSGAITRDQLVKLKDQAVAIKDAFGEEGILGKIGGANEIDVLTQLLTAAQELQSINAKAPEETTTQARLDAIRSIIDQIPDGGRELEASLQRSLNTAQQIKSVLGSGTPTTKQTGGMAFFANGGRGVDTIPAMLSPGEFVVNPKATSRFFSQLQAINAGKTPIFRQDGGSVTNVGDINVSVTGGQSSATTARQIASELRREIRRGTSRI